MGKHGTIISVRTNTMKEVFRKASAKIANAMGTASAFIISCLIVLVWGLTGPIFDYSDTWQLYINTGTTVATFLMVFVIQNTQNRDSKAVHLKLDELIHSSKSARNTFVELENLSDEELALLDEEFRVLHEKLHGVAAVKKLHSTIEAEKERRGGLRSAAGAVGRALKAPLSPLVNTIKTDTKPAEKTVKK